MIRPEQCQALGKTLPQAAIFLDQSSLDECLGDLHQRRKRTANFWLVDSRVVEWPAAIKVVNATVVGTAASISEVCKLLSSQSSIWLK